MLAFPAVLFAEEPPANKLDSPHAIISEVKFKTTDEVFRNTGNRFILAFFGNHALVSFLGDSVENGVKTEIEQLGEEATLHYVTPFPKDASEITGVLTIILYILVLVYFSSMMISFTMERIYMAQDGGDMGKSISSGGYMAFARSAFVFLIATPVAGYIGYFASDEQKEGILSSPIYSQLHLMLFKGFGMAFRVGDEINREFTQNNQAYYPTYTIPSPDVLKDQMNDFIDFGICVAGYPSKLDEDVVFKTKRVGNSVVLDLKMQDCTLYGKIPLDVETANILFSNKNIETESGFSYDEYLDFQEDVASDILLNSLKQSLDFSFKAMRVIGYVPNHIESKYKRTEIDTSNWYMDCPTDISSLIKSTDTEPAIILKNKKIASLCLSKQAVERLSYPIDISGDIDRLFFENKLPLPSRQFELCSNGFDLVSPIDDNNLKSCLRDSCDVSRSDTRSGVFNCSLAINMANKYYGNKHLHEKGFILAPISNLGSLIDTKMPSSPKSLLNNFEVSVESRQTDSIVSDYSSFLLNPLFSTDEELGELVYTILGVPFPHDTLNTYEKYSSITTRTPVVEVGTPPNFITGENSTQGRIFELKLLNTEKLSYCIGNPYSSSPKYGQCYGVTSELKEYGSDLARTLLYILAGKQLSPMYSKFFNRNKDKVAEYQENKINDASEGKFKGGQKRNKSPLHHVVMELKSAIVNYGFSAFITGGFLVGLSDLASGSTADDSDHYTARIDYESLNSSILFMLASFAADSYSKEDDLIQDMFRWVFWLLGTVVFLTTVFIPSIPILLYAGALFTSILAMIALLISAPFYCANAFASMNKDYGEKTKRVIAKWVVSFFRVPMLIIGFYVSIQMIDVLVPDFMTDSSLLYIVGRTSPGDALSVIGWFITVLSYIGFMFIIIFACTDTITSFYAIARSFVFNDKLDMGNMSATSDAYHETRKFVNKL